MSTRAEEIREEDGEVVIGGGYALGWKFELAFGVTDDGDDLHRV